MAQELLKVYLLNFVKAGIVNESDDVTTINYSSPSNHKSDEELSIGQQASRYLQTINDECEPAAIAQFYKSVKMGYIAAVDQLLKIFQFNCEMLKAVRLLNPNCRLQLTERQVLLAAKKLLPDFTDEQLDELFDEWKIYYTFHPSRLYITSLNSMETILIFGGHRSLSVRISSMVISRGFVSLRSSSRFF